MNFPTSLRDKRHFFGPTHYSIANYCTETKNEMKTMFGDEYFLHNLIPDHLKKNLADTIITEEKMLPKNEFNAIDVKTNENNPNRTENSPLTGITNFLSGVLDVISGAMFNRRKQTDFSAGTGGEMALECVWHGAKTGDENKILQDEKCPNLSDGIAVSEMGECRAAAADCQNKLDQVRLLLSKPVACPVRVKRRPKKVFVEPSSVEDNFQDAFAPEDFENLSNTPHLEYVSPYRYHDDDFHEISAPEIRIKTAPLCESTDIVKNVPEMTTSDKTSESVSNKEELIASCENKLSKLKALLQERKKKITEPEPVVEVVNEPPKQKPESKIKDKHYKNLNRCTDKRRKTKMRQNINNDILFANEINTDELSSAENSPVTTNIDHLIPNPSNLEYFDEMLGRFHSTSATDSEDSFQIVFNDSPRLRRTSDCESEDSFIIFDDSQDSCYASNNCYTTNDVFGDSSDSDSCDSDSELSDSGCGNLTFMLSHSLSKSVGNLTDDSLYNNLSGDEVDCSKVELTVCDKVTANEFNSGLLIDSRKKEIRKSLPSKKVQFSTQPPKVHVMRVWAFAAKQARAGHWERYALDRERFRRRIADVEVAVSWVLRPQHRSRVMFQRFMPWWNAQKRRELAEKKQKEEEKKEQERQQVNEEQVAEAQTSNLIIPSQTNQDMIIDVPNSVLDNPVQGFTPIPDSKLSASFIVAPSRELDDNPDQNAADVDSSSQSKVLDVGQSANDVNEELDDDIQLNNGETVLKYSDTSEVGSNNVYNQTQENGEGIIKKENISDATNLQIVEFDHRQSRVVQESKNELVQHNADKYSDENVKILPDFKNKQESGANIKDDCKNELNSKHKLLNEFLATIQNGNDVSTENNRGTNDSTENKQIVPFNDKIFNNDFVAQTVRNA